MPLISAIILTLNDARAWPAMLFTEARKFEPRLLYGAHPALGALR